MINIDILSNYMVKNWMKKLTLVPIAIISTTNALSLEIKSGEQYSVCQKIAEKIENTPDFFSRFEKEGYKYILFDSPFKRKNIEIVPKTIFYAVFMQNQATALTEDVYAAISYEHRAGACKDFPKNRKDCELQLMKIAKIDAEKGLTLRGYDFDSFFTNEKAFAYKTKTNLYSHSKIEEYGLGIIGNIPSGVFKGKPRSQLYIVDRYMRFHPKLNLTKRNSTVPGFPYGFPESASVGMGVPVDIDYRTFMMAVGVGKPFEKPTIFIDEHYLTEQGSNRRSFVCILEKGE